MHPVVKLLFLTTLTTSGLGFPSDLERESRDTRRYFADDDLEVDVPIKQFEMAQDQTITVRCRANGGKDLNDQPYVSFYRQLGDYTTMPISSGDPGVMVEPSVPSDEDIMDFFGEDEVPSIMKTVKVLTLTPESWYTLERGENLFYCKASTLKGMTKTSYFIVKKKMPPTRRRRPFPRWTMPPRG